MIEIVVDVRGPTKGTKDWILSFAADTDNILCIKQVVSFVGKE
jgi:hypothetical protein